MLDNTTKKRIDDCRDILVGKLPDPKSQIEQITIALIYKFMDDMDKESVELGGEAKFFSGDYAKYSWDSLFDAKVTATQMLKLYSQAIESMEKNPNIPQLFRDIFKNAYLPYRDPETLKLFLKTIGEFEYTHSEKLGDAFEYLLSVMGSQGDAGQFRTPRHIIDFLVEAVDPSKTDTILDPACGTAGFLISAFKRIKGKNNNQLTPDERKKLIKNFIGYDISPDMVRLSLVNLYLHGFSNPHIFEYDTLTSEERWNDTFDVVLANPPFMSPKGGIRPHKKFTVTSNRSEVLFVDYIAEHLNPNGRAGIIVPEGVIFQSGKAYKELRKMLVENYLYAVVSLPAGVFNPYSGVKTSILLMDKALAKKTNKILFVKIDNDGYNLGAQRNEIKGGQLGEAISIIENYKLTIENGKDFENTKLAHAVEKSKIAESGEFNLSGERYKEQIVINSDFPIVELKEVAEIGAGNSAPQNKELFENGIYPFCRTSDVGKVHLSANFSEITDLLNDKGIKGLKLFKKETILFPKSGASTFLNHRVRLSIDSYVSSHLATIYRKTDIINSLFLYHLLCNIDAKKLTNNQNYPSLKLSQIQKIKIPLPPLSVQEEIVAEIEGYQKIIDGAKMVVENYKPQIDIDPDWEMVELGEVCKVNSGTINPADKFEDWFTYLDISSVQNGTGIIDYSNKINVSDAPSRARRVVLKDDILLSTVRPNLKAFGYVDKEPDRFIASTGFAVLRVNKDKLISKFLYYLVFQEFVLSQMINLMGKGAYPSINQKDVNSLKIPIPNLEIQQIIVEQIEKEKEAVNSSQQLVEIFEQKIKDRIAKVWGK